MAFFQNLFKKKEALSISFPISLTSSASTHEEALKLSDKVLHQLNLKPNAKIRIIPDATVEIGKTRFRTRIGKRDTVGEVLIHPKQAHLLTANTPQELLSAIAATAAVLSYTVDCPSASKRDQQAVALRAVRIARDSAKK